LPTENAFVGILYRCYTSFLPTENAFVGIRTVDSCLVGILSAFCRQFLGSYPGSCRQCRQTDKDF
jgi:hypothetical protein